MCVSGPFSKYNVQVLGCKLPGDKVSADVKEDEETFIVGCEGPVSSKATALLSKTLQINHMQVDLLRNGRRGHGVRDHTACRPRSTVHVQVPISRQTLNDGSNFN